MALDFPAGPHPDGFQWQAPNNVTYTWRNGYWTGVNDEAGVVLQAPRIDTVTIVDQGVSADRFTNEEFLVNGVMDLGQPQAVAGLKVEITEDPGVFRALTRPSTTEIVDVQTVPFADGFEADLLNDNTWRDVYWCGAPYNCYIAQGNGTSVDNFATSTDGQNWTRRTATLNGAEWNVPTNFAWSPQDGRLYTLSSESNSGSGSRKATMFRTTDASLANAGFDFEQTTDPGIPSDGDHAHSGFGDLYWDPVGTRWYASRVSSQNGRSCGFCAGPQSASPAGSWINVATIIGSEVGRLMVHADGSGTWSGNGMNQSGSLSGNKTAYAPTASSASGVYWILGNGQEPVGRWAKVGTVGWICAASTGSGTNLGPRIAVHLGDQPPNTPNPTMLDPTVVFADEGITGANFRDALWIEDLGIGVICGQASTATRDNWGCVVTTTDCQNFRFLWTNGPNDDEQYRWDRMFWNEDRQELVLVAGAGTNPGVRAGFSQTVGEFLNLPQLTFLSADGLTNFAVGTAVDQSDANASGVIAAMDVDNSLMVIKGTPNGETWGPANTGLRVLGPAETYDPAYAVFDADGNVTRLSQFDPGFQQMNGQVPIEIRFPATFEGGNAPDDEIPAGSRIRAELQLTSTSNGFTSQVQQWSENITPT